jgi:hypothetical protein
VAGRGRLWAFSPHFPHIGLVLPLDGIGIDLYRKMNKEGPNMELARSLTWIRFDREKLYSSVRDRIREKTLTEAADIPARGHGKNQGQGF